MPVFNFDGRRRGEFGVIYNQFKSMFEDVKLYSTMERLQCRESIKTRVNLRLLSFDDLVSIIKEVGKTASSTKA